MPKLTQVINGEYIGGDKYVINQVGNGKSTVIFSPDQTIKAGTPVGAEIINEIQKNSLYTLKGTRGIVGSEEQYSINFEGFNDFECEELNCLFIPDVNNTSDKVSLLINQVKYTFNQVPNFISNEIYEIILNKSNKTVNFRKNQSRISTSNTIAELQSRKNLKVGDIVEVLGYYSAGDGAGHKRIIASEDDGSGVQLSNNLWACIVHNGEVNVSWFGAKGDGVTDDTEAIQKAVNYSDYVNIPIGNFVLTAPITINKPTSIVGRTCWLVFDRDNQGSGTYETLVGSNIICKTNLGCFKFYTNVFVGGFLIKGLTFSVDRKIIDIQDNFYLITDEGSSSSLSGIELTELNFLDIKNGIKLIKSERVKINKIFGVCFGNLITLVWNKDRTDIEQIHIQNGLSSTDVELVKNNDDYLIYCSGVDGLFIDNVFMHNKKRGIKVIGCSSQITRLSFDLVSQQLCIENPQNQTIVDNFFGIYSRHKEKELLPCIELKNSQEDSKNITLNNISVYTSGTAGILQGTESVITIGGLINCIANNLVSYYTYKNFIKILTNSSGLLQLDNCVISKDSLILKDRNALISNYSRTFNVSIGKLKTYGNSRIVIYRGIYNDNLLTNKQNRENIKNFYNNITLGNHFGSQTSTKENGKDFVKIKMTKSKDAFNGVMFQNLVDGEKYNTIMTVARVNSLADEDYNKNIIIYAGVETEFSLTELEKELIGEKIAVIHSSSGSGINSTYGANFTGDIDFFGCGLIDGEFGIVEPYNLIQNIEKQITETLDTPIYKNLMEQEGVYNDYISYMDEKTAYDKQQRKLEQEKQLAYEEALKENPELTYEEFMSVQPMTLNLVEEPQPSQALKDFMKKYL